MSTYVTERTECRVVAMVPVEFRVRYEGPLDESKLSDSVRRVVESRYEPVESANQGSDSEAKYKPCLMECSYSTVGGDNDLLEEMVAPDAQK